MGRPLTGRAPMVVAGLVLAAATLPPVLALFPDLAHAPASSLDLVASARGAALLLRSLGLALAVTGASLAIGVPLGVVFGRFDVVLGRVAWAVHGFPLAVPPFLLALGWFHAAGAAHASGALFSELGALLVLTFALCPIVTSLTAFAAAGLDPCLEEAASVVSGPWRVAARVIVPLCRPAIGLGAIAVFALAFSELAVPMFLRVDAYPATVFARLGGVEYAPGEAAALALPLVVVTVVLFVLERRFSRSRAFATLAPRSGTRASISLRKGRAAISALVWTVCGLGAVPLAALFVKAIPGFGRAGTWLDATPWNSLMASAGAALVIVTVGIIIGHGLARSQRSASILDALASLGFILPPSVLGVGLIGAWNHGPTQWVYASLAVIGIGFVARYSVIGVRGCAAALAQSAPEIEQAAQVFGAGYARRMVRILLPLHVRGIVGAWLLAFVFCLRDLETPVLLYPPGSEPLTVRIFTLEANGPPPVVAALAIVQVGLAACALALGGGFLARKMPR